MTNEERAAWVAVTKKDIELARETARRLDAGETVLQQGVPDFLRSLATSLERALEDTDTKGSDR